MIYLNDFFLYAINKKTQTLKKTVFGPMQNRTARH